MELAGFRRKSGNFLVHCQIYFSRMAGMCFKRMLNVVVLAGLGMPNFHYIQMPGQECCGGSVTTTQSLCQTGC